MCGHTRKDPVRNDDIQDRVRVAPIAEKLVQHRLRWFGHNQRSAPVHSGRLKHVDMSREVRVDQTWHREVRKERSEGLEYHQRSSHGQSCMEACYPCARTMSWLQDLMGSPLAYPNLFGTKGLVVVCCCKIQGSLEIWHNIWGYDKFHLANWSVASVQWTSELMQIVNWWDWE
jgi:hypothetical protein